MTIRASYWTDQLRECERPDSPVPSRVTWLRRVYARIYRFLLARYGEAEIRDVTPVPIPLIDSTESLEGKAARSSVEILAALKQIHAAQPAERPQRGASIAAADAWVTVMDRHKRFNFALCERMLGLHGIPTRQLAQGSHRRLQVPRAYGAEAIALVKESREALRLPPAVLQARQRASKLRRTLACLALGMLLGLPVLTVTLLEFLPNDFDVLLLCGLLFAIFTLIIGVAMSFLLLPAATVPASRLNPRRRRRRSSRTPRS